MRTTWTSFSRLLLLILILFSGCREWKGTVDTRSIREVSVSAHRGGPQPGFPENALPTLRRTASDIPGVMLEVDVRATSDQVLVLLHDRTLDRTTTLNGRIDQSSLEVVQSGFLKDEDGRITGHKVPTLSEVLDWLGGSNAFLSLDVKDGSRFGQVVDLVRTYGLQDRVEIITYSLDDALWVQDYAPETHLSMSIGSEEVLQKTLASGIDPSFVAAFTGLKLKEEAFYKRLKERGMVVTLGTMGNLDRMAGRRSGDLYRRWSESGIDRFATDRPRAVYRELENRQY